MTDYILLATAITFAIPYGYLLVAILFVQPRRISSYLASATLLMMWPTFLFVSFMQIVPIATMSLWWWAGDFELNTGLPFSKVAKRPIPQGLKYMFVCLIVGAMIGVVFAWNAYEIDQLVL